MNMVDKRCSCCGGENPEKVQIDAILARYQGKKGSLIPILQEVQALYNYLPKDALEYIAASTGTPIAQIYGVVTFYSQFHLNPRGRNIIRACGLAPVMQVNEDTHGRLTPDKLSAILAKYQ